MLEMLARLTPAWESPEVEAAPASSLDLALENLHWTHGPRIRPNDNALEIRRRGRSTTFHINGGEVARLAAGAQAGNLLDFAGDGRVDFAVDHVVARVE